MIAVTNCPRFPLSPNVPQGAISEMPPLRCGETEHRCVSRPDAEIGATRAVTATPITAALTVIRGVCRLWNPSISSAFTIAPKGSTIEVGAREAHHRVAGTPEGRRPLSGKHWAARKAPPLRQTTAVEAR